MGREKTKQAVESALCGDGPIPAIMQRRSADDDPGLTDLYAMGVTANMLRRQPLMDGTVKLIVSGIQRAAIVKSLAAEFLAAEINPVEDINDDITTDTLALSRKVLDCYEASTNAPTVRFQGNLAHPGMLADTAVDRIAQKQQLLETNDVVKRPELTLKWMKSGRQAP